MPSFPVFKLADIPLMRVFELIDYESLFTLSFASERSRSLVKKCTSLLTPRISVSVHYMSVQAHRGNSRNSWNFYNKRFLAAPDVNFKNGYYRLIGGVELKFGSDGDDRRVCVSEHPMNEAAVLADYLINIFSSELDHLEIETDRMEKPNMIFSVDCFKKSKSLAVHGFLRAEDYRKVLDEFETNDLTMWSQTSEGFVYEKPFHMDRLVIYNAKFFNRHNLLTLDCRQVRVSNNCLISSDINEFIHQWLQNGDNKLEFLCVSHLWRADASTIMEGLETIEGSQKNPEWTTFKYIYPKVRFEMGQDIRRASDGKLATILCDGSSFLFVVWQESNPFL